MKTRTVIIILTCVLVPGVLFSGIQQKDRRYFKRGIEDRIMSVLDSAQAKQWAEQRLKFRQEINVLQTSVRNARLELSYLLSSERMPNERAVKNAQGKIDEQTTRLNLKRVEQQLAIRKILTDEQWDKLSEMRKNPDRPRFRRGQMRQRQGTQRPGRQ